MGYGMLMNVSDNFRPAEKQNAPEVTLQLGLNFPALTAAYCIWKSTPLFGEIFWKTPGMGLWDFLSWNYQTGAEPVGCYVGNRMIGIGWICKAFKVGHEVFAEGGAAFFEATPPSLWNRAIDMFLFHAFIERKFDALYGVSKRGSAYAEMVAKRAGMTETDGLPWGEAVPPEAIVRKLDRRTWEFNISRRAVA
jgi:hypothetical protein